MKRTNPMRPRDYLLEPARSRISEHDATQAYRLMRQAYDCLMAAQVFGAGAVMSMVPALFRPGWRWWAATAIALSFTLVTYGIAQLRWNARLRLLAPYLTDPREAGGRVLHPFLRIVK